LCARPGCGAPAAATLRFQPTQREAWLVDLDDNAARTEGDLCTRHASTLVLPRGWQLHDERTPVPDAPARAVPPRRAKPRASIARARRRRARGDDDPLPGLAAVPETNTEPDGVEPGPVAVPDALSPPEREDLADALDAQTPLLRRAFQNVWPFDSGHRVSGDDDNDS
jgi:hypothetical protein